MHTEILPSGASALMERLSADPASVLRGWTLAGGAGLALRLGHRYSDDLDFFRNDPIDIPKLLRNLRAHGECEVWQEDPTPRR